MQLAGVLQKLGAKSKESLAAAGAKGRQDERGGASKRQKGGEGGSGNGSGSGSSRAKRMAQWNCVNPSCQLLDERPISVTAQPCGVCFFFIVYFLFNGLTCALWPGDPTCPRSENRIKSLMKASDSDE
jgi:hypothetical protein